MFFYLLHAHWHLHHPAKTSNAIDGTPRIRGGSGERWASLVGSLCPCTLRKYATIKWDGSFIIFDGDFLYAAGQFSPLKAPNSQFWLHSGRCKLCPHATTLPKPWGHGIIIANSIPQWSTLMKKLFDKIGEGGGFWFSLGFLWVPTEVLEYFDR